MDLVPGGWDAKSTQVSMTQVRASHLSGPKGLFLLRRHGTLLTFARLQFISLRLSSCRKGAGARWLGSATHWQPGAERLAFPAPHKGLLIFDPHPSRSLGPPSRPPSFPPCWPLSHFSLFIPWHSCSDWQFFPAPRPDRSSHAVFKPCFLHISQPGQGEPE